MSQVRCINITKTKKNFPQQSTLVAQVDVNCSAMFELDGKTYEEETYKSDIAIELTENELKVLQCLWDRLESSFTHV